MTGYLLSCLEDLYWVRGKYGDEVSVIGHEDHMAYMANQNIPSFYAIDVNNSEIDKAAEYLTLNWHRFENGTDAQCFKDISIAEAFSVGAWITNSSICREYFCLKSWLNKYKLIYISCNESKYFIEVAKLFGSRVRIFDPRHRIKPRLSSFNNRILLINKTPFYINFFRYLQAPFLSLLQHKTIAIKDWTILRYEKKQPNWLSINTLRFWKSSYLRDPTICELSRAASRVPEDFNESLSSDSLISILKRINVSWDTELVVHISENMKIRYRNYRQYFIWTVAMYENLLNSYRPVELVITSEMYEPYSIANQLARSKGIKTAWMVDGYPTIPYSRLLGSKQVGPYYFDVVYAIGHKHRIFLEKNVRIGQKLIQISPPILECEKKILKTNKRYDVILMTLSPNDLSINGYLGSRVHNLIEMIHAAHDFGFKKIAIKIKHPSERAFISELRQRGLINNIDVLEGKLSRHINSTGSIIGGISSAIGEAIFNKIPYYIFEPISNGYNEDQICCSWIFKKEFVARSKEELTSMLASSKHLSVDQNDVL